MKIESVRICNFRSFADQTVVFDDYTCLVGPNGSGKSTVLTALNIFFRETENVATNLVELGKEDFHNCDTTAPIRITVTFADLSVEAKEALKDYARQDKLVVSAVAKWNDQSQSAPVLQFGERLGIEAFRKYFEMDKGGAKAPALKEFYGQLRIQFAGLPVAGTKAQMEEALHSFESTHPESCILIPSEDQFYGFSRAASKLEKYIQWIYIPAVKDASAEQIETKSSAIGKLLARRVHSQLGIGGPVEAIKQQALAQYRDLLSTNQPALDELSESLNRRFHEWAHQDASLNLQWQDQDKAVAIAKPTAEVKAQEGVFQGDIARFGHGLQRSFIFALLEELAEHRDDGPRLILGCEEPELYQHPPQARHLATVLQKLSNRNAEVIICTHSPYFISGRSFENVRLASKDTDGSVTLKKVLFEDVANAIAAVTGEPIARPGGMAAKIDQDMASPMNEMFFAGYRIFVEGLEDVAYLSSYLSLRNLWDEFRSIGGDIIPVQGKHHLILALAIANAFGLRYFAVFDCDGDTRPDDREHRNGRRDQHERDNRAILSLAGIAFPEPFPTLPLIHDKIAAWPTKLSDVVEGECGKSECQAARDEVRRKYGIDVGGMNKNSLFIGYTMAEVWEAGHRSATLESLCDRIMEVGRGGEMQEDIPDTAVNAANV